MKQSKLLFSLFIATAFIACKSSDKKSYAIRDFRKELQPGLTNAVTKGVVSFFDTSVINIIKDKELMQLTRSEHPILRALAFRAMLRKPSFNHFDIIMNNLSDTAFITTSMGEFGLGYCLVSDDILEVARWKDSIAKNKTIEAVLTKHNYLRSAYKILLYIEPQEKYYKNIKEMAERDFFFDDIEYALYGLARFKKTGDIKFIAGLLLNNCYAATNISLRLMEEYPNDAYMDVFKKYYKRKFGQSIDNDHKYSFTKDFFNSLASYKNDESAKLLDTILNKKPFLYVSEEADYLKEDLIYAIWNNKCPAYSNLIEQVKDSIKKYEINTIGAMISEPGELNSEFKEEPLRWLSR